MPWSEQERANLSQFRGRVASMIQDPEERRKFIAKQGELESKGKADVTALGAEAIGRQNIEAARPVLGSMQEGGFVSETGPYLLHQGETVAPALTGEAERARRAQLLGRTIARYPSRNVETTRSAIARPGELEASEAISSGKYAPSFGQALKTTITSPMQTIRTLLPERQRPAELDEDELIRRFEQALPPSTSSPRRIPSQPIMRASLDSSTLPSMQEGGFIPETGPYFMHEGEMVAPALTGKGAAERRRMIGGAGVPIGGTAAPPEMAPPTIPGAPPGAGGGLAGVLPASYQAESRLGPRPSPGLYKPRELHGGRKALAAIFAGMGGFQSPELGRQIYEQEFVQPRREAQANYQRDIADWNQRFAQELQTQGAERESAYKTAQEAELRAKTKQYENWVPMKIPGLDEPVPVQLKDVERMREALIKAEAKPGKPWDLKYDPGTGLPTHAVSPSGVAYPVGSAQMPSEGKALISSAEARHKTHLTEQEQSEARKEGYKTASEERRDIKKKEGEVRKMSDEMRRYDALSRVGDKILKDIEARPNKLITGPEFMQLLALHVGGSVGGVKGMRVGREILEEHVKARPWDQKLQAFYNSVVGGGNVSIEQVREWMGISKEIRRERWGGISEAAKERGIKGPKIPGDIEGEARKETAGKAGAPKWNPKTMRYE